MLHGHHLTGLLSLFFFRPFVPPCPEHIRDMCCPNVDHLFVFLRDTRHTMNGDGGETTEITSHFSFSVISLSLSFSPSVPSHLPFPPPGDVCLRPLFIESHDDSPNRNDLTAQTRIPIIIQSN